MKKPKTVISKKPEVVYKGTFMNKQTIVRKYTSDEEAIAQLKRKAIYFYSRLSDVQKELSKGNWSRIPF